MKPVDIHELRDAPADSREGQMVVVSRDKSGTPTIWCDPEIVDIVKAMNEGGVQTVASCSGHGYRPGWIALADGRQLVVAKDLAQARQIGALFPIDINGLAVATAEEVQWDIGSPCMEPRPVGMVYPPKPKPRASGYLDGSGVEWNAYDTAQMEAYARDAVASYHAAPAAPATDSVGESRFFIDHGVVHDRKTGKHVGAAFEEDSADRLLALLQELSAPRVTGGREVGHD